MNVVVDFFATVAQEYPPMMQLQVHLEHEQYIVFDEDDETVSQRPRDTHLTAFFKANEQYPEARTVTYPDFPSKFTWNYGRRSWSPRKGAKTSGRMVFVPPNAGEKFYARLLLSVVCDVRSFADLRTVQGVLYDTYREACLARGLLADDSEWKRTLEDGAFMQTGSQLRQLFITIVAENHPSRPAQLWHLFKVSLCDDLRRTLMLRNVVITSDEQIFDYGLHLLQMRLARDDKSMETVGLPKPHEDWASLLSTNVRPHQYVYNRAEQSLLLQDALPRLNEEQLHAFNSVLQATVAHAPETFFLQGAAGAGKTFVYKTLCYATRSRDMRILCVASSGIAALLLPGGRTAHSTLKIPLLLDHASTCAISKRSALANTVKEVNLIIWDECSMQNRLAFEAVDRSLQDIRGNNELFGGVTAVLGGDFLQTLPIVPFPSKSDTLNAALFSSPLWRYIQPRFLKLETNMRVGNDPEEVEFAQWQRTLARGELNDADDYVVVPHRFLCENNDIFSLVSCTYPDIDLAHGTQYFQERCVLAPRNREAHEINNVLLDMFPGDAYDLWSVDEAFDPDNPGIPDDTYSPDVLHSATPSGFPQAHLCLKIGCPVIVLRNLHSDEGVCNGSRGIVTQVKTRCIEILLHGSTKPCLIPRIKLISAQDKLPFQLHRRQFPLALAFAMTINKSQGQSFSTVGIDLRVPAFAHGQVYVAFSRGRSCKTVKCILDDATTPRTKNVVYREAIL